MTHHQGHLGEGAIAHCYIYLPLPAQNKSKESRIHTNLQPPHHPFISPTAIWLAQMPRDQEVIVTQFSNAHHNYQMQTQMRLHLCKSPWSLGASSSSNLQFYFTHFQSKEIYSREAKEEELVILCSALFHYLRYAVFFHFL